MGDDVIGEVVSGEVVRDAEVIAELLIGEVVN